METIVELTLLGQILAAVLLAAAVGVERELAKKPAGLRTHMLMGGAACLLVILGDKVVAEYGPEALISSDPIRIIQAIVVGVSFLGAGIFRANTNNGDAQIEGTTTGASLLSVAGVGIAVALELWWLAFGVTLTNVIINRGVDWFETILKDKRAKRPS